MTAARAKALALQYGADLPRLHARPETGPWLAHPTLSAHFMAQYAAEQGDEGLAIAWACDLLAVTEIGVRALSVALGRNLAALVRMASREVRGVGQTYKPPAVYWRVVSRGPAAVHAAAACAWLAHLDAARRWQTAAEIGLRVDEGERFVVPLLHELPTLQAAVCRAIGAEIV